jgi:EAL domain-containing protein (putative c-di-GMP-specific phosphodiesterase class I)
MLVGMWTTLPWQNQRRGEVVLRTPRSTTDQFGVDAERWAVGTASRPSGPTGRLEAALSEGRILNVLLGLAAINGIVCIFAPGWVVLRQGGSDARVGDAIYVAAVAALALTPLQLMFLWFVVGGRLHEIQANKRTTQRIRDVLHAEAIETAFQPIFDLVSRRVVGVEALSRFSSEPVTTPDVWFADAERLGLGLDLELLAIRAALRNVEAVPEHLYIALNVSPKTLMHPRLIPTLLRGPVAPSRLVLEVTEHTCIPDYGPLQEARASLRHHGIRLAVDDAGSGYSSLRHIVALAPDIIKLDRALVTGIDHDEARRALVAAVVMYALQAGAVLLAEGVETAAELDAIEGLGVDAAQGFHLGRPTTHSQDWAGWGDKTSVLRPSTGIPLRPLPTVPLR